MNNNGFSDAFTGIKWITIGFAGVSAIVAPPLLATFLIALAGLMEAWGRVPVRDE